MKKKMWQKFQVIQVRVTIIQTFVETKKIGIGVQELTKLPKTSTFLGKETLLMASFVSLKERFCELKKIGQWLRRMKKMIIREIFQLSMLLCIQVMYPIQT